MGQQGLLVGVAHGGQAEQSGVISQVAGQRGFGHGLRGAAADAGNPHERFAAAGVEPVELLGGQAQDGLEQADLGIADGELRGVHADGNASRPGRRIVSP